MIQVTPPDVDKKEIEELVNADIVAFSKYFSNQGNDPLSKYEAAIIKTFMYWLLFIREDG